MLLLLSLDLETSHKTRGLSQCMSYGLNKAGSQGRHDPVTILVPLGQPRWQDRG